MKEDDVDDALRAYAERWRAAQPPPPDATVRRADARSGRSRLAVLGAAAAVVLVVGGAALLASNPEQDPGAPAAMPTTGAPSSRTASAGPVVPTRSGTPSPAQSPSTERCRPLHVRPTYLPWIEEGTPIPRPYIWKQGPPGPQSNASILDWHAPTSKGKDPYYVSLRRYTDLIGGGPGETVPARLFGQAGEFYEGTVPGDAAIEWSAPGACNVVTLELSAHTRMTRAEARREIIRIAQSLR